MKISFIIGMHDVMAEVGSFEVNYASARRYCRIFEEKLSSRYPEAEIYVGPPENEDDLFFCGPRVLNADDRTREEVEQYIASLRQHMLDHQSEWLIP